MGWKEVGEQELGGSDPLPTLDTSSPDTAAAEMIQRSKVPAVYPAPFPSHVSCRPDPQAGEGVKGAERTKTSPLLQPSNGFLILFEERVPFLKRK